VHIPIRQQPTLFYGSVSDLASVPSVFSPSGVTGWVAEGGFPDVRMTHNFSIELQRSVGFKTLVTAAYVGSNGKQLAGAAPVLIVTGGPPAASCLT